MPNHPSYHEIMASLERLCDPRERAADLADAQADGLALLAELREQERATQDAIEAAEARDRRRTFRDRRSREYRRRCRRWYRQFRGYAGALLVWTLILLCCARPLILAWAEGR